MSKDLWIEARERRIQAWYDEFDRDPTDAELEEWLNKTDFYADYVSGIADSPAPQDIIRSQQESELE